MMAIAHDPKVTELQTMFQTFLVPSRTYDLKVQKTIINRLKKPFPSNCTDDKHWDIFEGTERAGGEEGPCPDLFITKTV